MESLLLPIINYISQSFPEIPYVDEDYGQLEAIDNENMDNYPVVFPCVLINTDSVDWSSLSAKSQKGTAHICVRLCIDCYADTHFGSNTTDKIKERSSLVHRLHESLQTYRPLAVGAFVRTKSKFYAWFQLRFDVGIERYTTYLPVSPAAVTLRSDVGIERYTTTPGAHQSSCGLRFDVGIEP